VVKGWDMFCPPVAARGQGEHTALFPSPARSLIGIEPAGLPLTAFKAAEDGKGYVLRLCDFAGEGGTAKLTLPRPVRELFRCDLVEANAQALKGRGKTISAPVKAFAPLTLEAHFAP
jgi:alpha-mannosidase